MGNRNSSQGRNGNCQCPEYDVFPPQRSNSSFPELIGMDARRASRRIARMGLQPEIVYPGQPVSYDLNYNRVRLTVDRSGYGTWPVPTRG